MPISGRTRTTLGHHALAIALAGLAVWAFAGTRHAFFAQDDYWMLEAVRRPWPDVAMLGGVLLPDFVRPLPTYWWPLGLHAVFGPDATAFHIAQLLLHAITVHALFRALLAFTGEALGAAVGTALYALATVHVYTLGWVAGTIDGLCACGFAHALWDSLHGATDTPARGAYCCRPPSRCCRRNTRSACRWRPSAPRDCRAR